MKTLFFIIAGGLLLFSQGCTHFTGYSKGNILCVGARTFNEDNGIFYDITIRCDKEPFNPDINQFAIKLSNDRILLSKQFNYLIISSIPNIDKREKEDLTECFFIDGYIFHFREKKLIYFNTRRYVGDKVYTPMIGKTEGEKFYAFPITQKQLESIFGEPDKYINDYSYL